MKENLNLIKKSNINFNIFKLFHWGWFKFSKCTIGILIYALAINLFLIPNHLYTGGILGTAQLIRTAINTAFHLDINFDISSVIYYMINFPLFLIAYKGISKTFFIRTLFAVTLNSLFLMLIPIPSEPLIKDLLGNVLIGGAISGTGIGMVLSTGSSSGGVDIIGILASQKSKKLTVGTISLAFNVMVYSICGIQYGIETMIYSIIFAVFETMLIDKTHTQNICSEAYIFTKEHPAKMIKFINNDLLRGATYWEAIGGYTNTKTYITYTVLSKYERMRLERHMKEFDPNAFMVGEDGVEIKGRFNKNFI